MKFQLTESELITLISRIINEQGNEMMSAAEDIKDQYSKEYDFFKEINNTLNTNGWSKRQMTPNVADEYDFKLDPREAQDFPTLYAFRERVVDVGYGDKNPMKDEIYVGWDDDTRRLKVIIFNPTSGDKMGDEIYGPKKNSDSDKNLVLDFIETLRKRGVQVTAQNESYRRSKNTLTESDMRRLTRRILK